MLTSPFVKVVAIIKNDALTGFLANRRALYPDELAISWEHILAPINNTQFIGASLLSELFSEVPFAFPQLDTEDMFKKTIKRCIEEHKEDLIVAFPTCIHVGERHFVNDKIPAYINQQATYVIDKMGHRSLLEIVKELCSENFNITSDQEYKNIQILPKS